MTSQVISILQLPSDWLSTFSMAVINTDNEYTYLIKQRRKFY